MQLTEIEIRALGSLIEKQVTTPEYYPLTLNSLTLACNQKNNRHPVTSLSEAEVEQALNSLRDQNLAYVYHGSTSRVPKFKHVATEVLHLNSAELAVMCVLMLSGAQTVGEIRGRASRLHEFSGLPEVEQTLHALSTRDEPLVIKLLRQAGQKDARFVHLLSGEVSVEEIAVAAPATRERQSSTDRISQLEQKVDALSAQVENLGRLLEEFRKQFE